MKIKEFYHKDTFTLTYVVWDESSNDGIIIDPVMDYDPAGSFYSYESVEEVLHFVQSNKLNIHLILETHAHADHITGSQYLKEKLGDVQVGIGQPIKDVQKTFKEVFNLEELSPDGTQFDLLFSDGEELTAGELKIKTIHTPGHTPACFSFLIEDALFTGDALFMPDYGVGRCDFPLGSAKQLYHSVKHKIYELPDSVRVFTGHDYQPKGRELKFESTLKDQKQGNIHLNQSTTEDEFVEFREARDKTLNEPKLILPSVQLNINAGKLFEKESNGMSYIKLPMRKK